MELVALVLLAGVLVVGVVFSLIRRRDDDPPAMLEAGRSHMRSARSVPRSMRERE